MQPPRIPPDEAARLASLRRYEILDTGPEPDFDALTELLARLLRVPIALVSLVDAERQWFKARYGLDAPETPRDLSFCGHVVAECRPLVVNDAHQDPRFADNPLVVGDPHVTFYAGFPLVTPEGHALGTLCAIDHQPRQLTPDEAKVIEQLAAQVVALLELRRARREVEVERQALRTLQVYFSVSLDMLCTVNADLYFEDLNPAWQDVLGWTFEELRARPLTHFVHPDDLAATLAEASRLTEEHRSVHFVNRYRHRDGHWVSLSWTAVRRGDRYYCATHDLSKLAASEAALAVLQREARVEESRRQLLFETMAEGVVFQDVTGAIREANQAASLILGLEHDQLLGRTSLDPRWKALDADGQPLPGDRHPAMVALRTGEPQVNATMLVNTPAGDRRQLSVNSRIVVDGEGAVQGVVTTFRDVTGEVGAKRALAATEARFRGVVDSAADGILTLDARGRIESANPAAARLFGYEAEALVGRAIDTLLAPIPGEAREARPELGFGFDVTRVGGLEVEVLGVRADGDCFPAEVRVGEFEVDGRPTFTGIVRDLTERKKVERMQAEFVSTVSHELRTPLTSIRGSLGLMAGGLLGPVLPEIREHVDIAVKNCDRLARLINDLLDVERMASGQMAFRYDVFDLATAVHEALVTNEGFAEGHAVTLELVGEPEAGGVLADPDRLAQVMANLLSNAVKFSPAGAQVEVSVRRVAGVMRVGVRDHGPGIPAEFRERVFTRFAQADASDARPKSGTGLGLYIVKVLIERMRGRVGFIDLPGGGTEFFFELPRVADGVLAPPGPGGGGRVMLCTGDIDLARSLAEGLTALGVVVQIAPTEARARSLLDRDRFDLIAVDPALVDGDSERLFREVRRQPWGATAPLIPLVGRPADLVASLAWRLASEGRA